MAAAAPGCGDRPGEPGARQRHGGPGAAAGHAEDRLAETLLAWLQHGCNANEVAVRVHVHPQTVRYRLRQVDELFGGQLRDPDRRFELEIALRTRQMLQRTTRNVAPAIT